MKKLLFALTAAPLMALGACADNYAVEGAAAGAAGGALLRLAASWVRRSRRTAIATAMIETDALIPIAMAGTAIRAAKRYR